jgi:2-polyprenyl-6-methoxyphenol hydroxylase-like FAD-dependent oxidoreductase
MGLGEQFDRIPHVEVQTIELQSRGRLVFRDAAAGHGRAPARAVSQSALLQMLADEAGQHPSFRLERGVTVRELLREDGRVVGVRAARWRPRSGASSATCGWSGRRASPHRPG